MNPLSEREPLPPAPPPAYELPRARPRRRSGGLQALLFALTFVTAALAGGMWWEGASLEGSLLEVLRQNVVVGAVYAVWVLAILAAHEMGHYLACRYYGIPATLPFFIPGIPPLGTFGAVIRIRGAIPNRNALFDVAAAGPIAGFVLTVPVLCVGILRAEPFSPGALEPGEAAYLGRPVLMVLLDWLLIEETSVRVNSWIGAGWVGLLVTSLNLFPVGQLDGGHAAYAVSRKLHRVLARVTIVVLAGVIFTQVWIYNEVPAYVVWFAILLWMRDRHPRLMDESVPLGTGRKLIALALVAIFALSFIFVPIYFE